MKPVKSGIKKAVKKKVEKIKNPRTKKRVPERKEDIQRLVHLLEVHQIELEHQNQELEIAHEELEVSRNKYVSLFDFSPIPYFTLDPDGNIKETNLNASKLFGFERRKLIGRNILTFIQSDGRENFKLFLNAVFNSASKQSCHLRVTNIDKQVLQVQFEAIKIEDLLEPGKKCLVALIDLTDFKNIEYSLNDTNEKLKSIIATKDKFFAIIAHDLRNPFQALLNFSDILATKSEDLSPDEIMKFNKSLNEKLKNTYVLLENLLNWSMIQRDELEYEPVNLNLNEVVNKTNALLKQLAIEKNITLSNNIGNEIVVNADGNMLHSIVQNLIMNAIKFTPKDGHIIVSAEDKGSLVEVSVNDTGIGVETAQSDAIFNFGTVFTNHGTNDEKGTGLGLPICKEFVERNGGKIRVESEIGQGSKFIFTLRKKNS
jgi:PAS domain S-box-containing protein